jgi:8-oxo-dGTP pyrophosphatase MutT (NUDIX family)
VSALVLHGDALVLVVKQDRSGVFCGLPCGGQEHGETLADAVRREFWEEVGLPVTVGELLFVREYIGQHHEHASSDAQVHVTDHIFRGYLADESDAAIAGATPHGRDPDQVGVAWVPVSALDQYRFYPRALIGRIQAIARDGRSPGPVYVGDVN